jgi:antigen flippase
MDDKRESKSVLKATGTIGGGQVINILISLVKTKIVAIVLGPSGVGVFGLLTTAVDMIKNIAGFGLPFSGVRDISIAEGKNDDVEVSRVVKIFNKWVLLSAFFGAFIALAFCLPLSNFLFKNSNYTFGIAFLSISIFFTTIGAGFGAIMQGKRAVVMMAKSAIIANLFSSIIAVILFLVLKEDGIIPALVVSSIINYIVTYYFYRKLAIPDFGKIQLSESWISAKGMLRIGFFTIIVSVFDQLMSLGLRSFITEKSGIEGVGLFTAATTIATMYLSVVLGSLGSDYYPKLASINEDNASLHKAVNTQLYIVLILASPIIIGMVGFSEFAIRLLYSDKFIGAADVLKWQILGDFFKIISWPCGFVFLAKGLGKLYVFTSVFYTVFYTIFIYFGWNYFGFFGVGVSFFIAQFLSVSFTYIYGYSKFGIYITTTNVRIIAFFAVLLIIIFLSQEYLMVVYHISLSILVVLLSLVFSIRHLHSVVDLKSVFNKITFKK